MTDRSNHGRRHWTLVPAVGIVGLVVVGAVLVAVGGQDHTTTARPSVSRVTANASAVPTVTRTHGCAVTDASSMVPTSTPQGLTWSLWRGAALPRSKAAGPLKVDENTGLTYCYAHTPIGALMALVNIDYRMILTAPDTTVVDAQAAEGPYKARYRAAIATSRPPDDIPQLAGFRYENYSRDTATIKFAVGDQATGLAGYESTAIWRHGTWQDVIGANDVDINSTEHVDDLTGYVRLKGVS